LDGRGSNQLIPKGQGNRINVLPLPIGFSTAISAAMLPLIHRDLFDRIIIAEAIKEKMTILTKDNKFSGYGVESLW
jgi:PIN domain nuclease of toxin-antitoxin system